MNFFKKTLLFFSLIGTVVAADLFAAKRKPGEEFVGHQVKKYRPMLLAPKAGKKKKLLEQKEQKDEKDALYAFMPNEQQRKVMGKSLDTWVSKNQSRSEFTYIELTPDCELKDFYAVLYPLIKTLCEKDFENMKVPAIFIHLGHRFPDSEEVYKNLEEMFMYNYSQHAVYFGYQLLRKLLLNVSAQNCQSQFRSFVWILGHELGHGFWSNTNKNEQILKRKLLMNFENYSDQERQIALSREVSRSISEDVINKGIASRYEEMVADVFATEICYKRFSTFNPDIEPEFFGSSISGEEILNQMIESFFAAQDHPSHGFRRSLIQEVVKDFGAEHR